MSRPAAFSRAIDSAVEEELRAFAARDPAVTTGTAEMEIGTMLAGFVRPR
jgi:hypothetical protein